MGLNFELITNDNSVRYSEHKEKIVKKSGIDANPIYNPYTQDALATWKWPVEVYLLGLKKELDEVGWKRSWALIEDNKILGSLDLVGSNISSSLHRCVLMMGVSSDSRGRGLGREILSFAIKWAKENGLLYVDLGVFDTNEPACRLYRSFGFVEIGRRDSAFIVSGQNVGDIQMTYKLV